VRDETPPIPLTDSDGVLYAFACPGCRRVCASVSGMGGYWVGGRPNPQLVEEYLKEAERCCRCTGCGRRKRLYEEGCTIFTCDDCKNKRRDAEESAQRASKRSPSPKSRRKK